MADPPCATIIPAVDGEVGTAQVCTPVGIVAGLQHHPFTHRARPAHMYILCRQKVSCHREMRYGQTIAADHRNNGVTPVVAPEGLGVTSCSFPNGIGRKEFAQLVEGSIRTEVIADPKITCNELAHGPLVFQRFDARKERYVNHSGITNSRPSRASTRIYLHRRYSPTSVVRNRLQTSTAFSRPSTSARM